MTFGRRTAATVLATTVVFAAAAAGAQEEFERTPAPSDASVRIISPQDGATVSSPVTVIFGLSGMGVAPAGVQQDNTGHHHLMVNRELPPFDQVIPASDQSIHYGGGQTEATVELPPGEHTLQLLLGDWRHVPHEPPVYSDVVTITVE